MKRNLKLLTFENNLNESSNESFIMRSRWNNRVGKWKFKKLFDLSGLTLCHFLAQVSGRLVCTVFLWLFGTLGIGLNATFSLKRQTRNQWIDALIARWRDFLENFIRVRLFYDVWMNFSEISLITRPPFELCNERTRASGSRFGRFRRIAGYVQLR